MQTHPVLTDYDEDQDTTFAQAQWRRLRTELEREGGNARLLAVALLAGLLSLAILLPLAIM